MNARPDETMQRLHEDHRHAARLLADLEREHAKVLNDGEPRFELMRDIMRYMTTYPDCVHHRVEDLAVARLVRRAPHLAPVCERLATDHMDIAERGGHLMQTLVGVTDGEMVERAALAAAVEAYVSGLRAHMNYEEREVFPLLEALLEHEDWLTIATTFAAHRDPVFAAVADDGFANLLAHIDREAG